MRSLLLACSWLLAPLAAIMVVSLGGFAFLQLHPMAQQARVEGDELHLKKHADEDAPLVVCTSVAQSDNDDSSHDNDRHARSAALSLQSTTTIPELTRREIVRHVWQYLACQLILAAFSFGVLPSVMSYVYRKFAVRVPSGERDEVTKRRR